MRGLVIAEGKDNSTTIIPDCVQLIDQSLNDVEPPWYCVYRRSTTPACFDNKASLQTANVTLVVTIAIVDRKTKESVDNNTLQI
jgi:hypothetical protein